MSDPMHRPDPVPPPQHPADTPPPKGANPLIWILLLIALLAFGWYFFNQRGADVPPVTEPAVLPAPVVTSEQDAAAERERQASAERERASAPAPAAPADRDAAPAAAISPAYPATALRNGEQGTVVIEADVDAAGGVTDARIAERSGSRDLDRAALDAVRAARFEPALAAGKAVASTVRVPIEFRPDTQ